MGHPGSACSLQPLSFEVYEREIIGLWVPVPSWVAPLLPVLSGRSPPRSGELRVRPGSRVDVRRAGDLPKTIVEDSLVLVDCTEADLNLEAWLRLAVSRERGSSALVLTSSPMQAYRTDRVALAMWSLHDLLYALEGLLGDMSRSTRDLLGGQLQGGRAIALVAELQRANRAARDLMGQARHRARSADDRLRLSDLTARFAGTMLDERVLEALVAEAQR
jgi:hypothetical protein